MVAAPGRMPRRSLHGQWSSRLAFVLAVSGSAIGLGNVWRFPYIAGENGGGAFVLVYLACVFGVGLPIMMAEILLGRRGRRNPVATMRVLGEEESGAPQWGVVGMIGVVCGFLILSYYSVIAGWALAYIGKAASGVFTGADGAAVTAIFGAHISSSTTSGLWHTAFMLGTVLVVARGVERGLERGVRILMPALFLLLVVMLGYSAIEGDFAGGLRFLFEPRFEELTSEALLVALGHAFFTLSVGMGAVMAYGAYLPDEASISATSVAVVSTDTAVSILACLVIFPIVFANGLDPAAGPGLVFQSLPLAFGQMPGGVFVAVVFFLLLTFAAWTSAISLMEPAVAWLVEALDITRRQSAVIVGAVVWLLGLLTVLSFGEWSDLRFLRGTMFDNIDYLTNNIMLPVGGLAIVVFAGWVMCQNSSADEIDPQAGPAYRLWRFAARFVAPLAVVLILLNALEIF